MLTPAKKWQLLEALYQHGADIQALKEALPGWNMAELTGAIKLYRMRAQKRVADRSRQQTAAASQSEQEWKRLDKWYDLTQRLHQIQGTSDFVKKRGRQRISSNQRDHSPLLSKVMASIASLEDHPLPANPSQPNYTQIYKYLSQMLVGEEPTELDPASAARVIGAMARVRQVAEKAIKSGNYHTHLFDLPPEIYEKRSQKKKDGSSSSNDRGETEGTDCPLFQDPEDEDEEGEGEKDMEGGSNQELSPDDPYFEIKRENLVKKVLAMQEKSAAEVKKIQGFDPYLVPTNLLVKPSSTLIDPCPTPLASPIRQVRSSQAK